MTHNRYAVFFLFVAMIAIVLLIFSSRLPVRIAFAWLSLSCIWVSAAFLLHQPFMIMGKRPDGRISPVFLSINFPFLVIYWTVWLPRNIIFEKKPVNQISGTNISISCWPIWRVPLKKYDFVIDVTSEMPKWYHVGGKYVCLPNIDGVPLDRIDLPGEIDQKMHILVHCAQGRGRSAIMTCMVLCRLGHASNGEEAFRMLKQARPKVSVSKMQMTQIAQFRPEMQRAGSGAKRNFRA